jgi:uncharacterized alpha-E superfamily protein
MLMISACASGLREGDRSFASGDYLQAAAAYETYTERHPTARDVDAALFRLALACTMPGSRVFDRARAVATLQKLVRSHPTSEYRAPAEVMLGLLARLDELETEMTATGERLAALEASSAEALKTSEDQVARLRASLADSEAQVRRLRDELARLKSIDLRR